MLDLVERRSKEFVAAETTSEHRSGGRVSSRNDLPQNLRETEWQSLGEIKLPAGPGPATRRIITAWLKECTRPLKLPGRFAREVTSSALKASSAIPMPREKPLEAPYLVLCIYVPRAVLAAPGRWKTWALVSVGARERKPEDTLTPTESVDLYLYPQNY